MSLISIIIPHKNTPELLERCINSIPNNTDIEVVIVDDNSSSDIVDFNNFPGIDRENVNVVFHKGTSNGAGAARNIGLEIANGEWILFSDADDEFTPNFSDSVIKYIHSTYDIIYFALNREDNRSKQGKNYQDLFTRAFKGNSRDIDLFLYKTWQPWAKMIRKSYIDSHQIRFEDRIIGNDCYFGLMANIHTKKIFFDASEIYTLHYSAFSLSHNYKNSWLYEKERIFVNMMRYEVYKQENVTNLMPYGVYQSLKHVMFNWGPMKFVELLIELIKRGADFVTPIKNIFHNGSAT